MDAAFQHDEGSRAHFLRLVMQFFGCFYIGLWSYMPPPSNCLFFLDGVYDEENQPSSSSGSLAARRYFDDYRLSIFNVVENECVPGFAFRNSLSYVELQEMDLKRLASSDIQRQFYQEARIKNAVFMGCKSGEIELGFSNLSQINIKRELLRTWLPEAFSGQLSPHTEIPSRPTDLQNPHSSSTSSLRSLSTMDSAEYSSLLFNIPTTTTSHNIPEVLISAQPPNPLQPVNITFLEPIPTTMNIISSSITSPHQQAIQAFSGIRNTQFPAPEIEDAAMTKAILAVLSSSPPSSHQPPPQTNIPLSSSITHLLTPNTSAFKTYNTSALSPRTQKSANLRRQTMLKRSISFLRSLNLIRFREGIQATSPTSSQLHHMISERKRREKINESFHTLKSLLPSGTKKDKASVLTTARDYLTSLKAQVAELSRRNQQLEARLSPAAKEANEAEAAAGSSNERVSVMLTRVISESTPDDQDQKIIDLQVVLRSVECCTEDMVIQISEFLKRVKNVSLMSMEANIWISESNFNFNRVILRLRVDQGIEWDETAFQEAVRRVVADLALE